MSKDSLFSTVCILRSWEQLSFSCVLWIFHIETIFTFIYLYFKYPKHFFLKESKINLPFKGYSCDLKLHVCLRVFLNATVLSTSKKMQNCQMTKLMAPINPLKGLIKGTFVVGFCFFLFCYCFPHRDDKWLLEKGENLRTDNLVCC